MTGERVDPAGAPTEHGSSEQRAEEPRHGLVEAAAHHADSREDEAAERDDGPGKDGERFEAPQECVRPGEVNCALSVGDGSEDYRHQNRSQIASG